MLFQDIWDIAFNTTPGAFFFILFISITITLVSQFITRWLVDTEEIERKQRQIKAHEEEKQKIVELAQIDVQRYRKARKRWERKDIVIKKAQQRMGLQRMKPMCVTFLPIMIMWIVIGQMFGTTPAALAPMNPEFIPILGGMITVAGKAPWITYTAWYMLCSFSFQSLFSRLLKTQSQTTGGGFGQMLSGQKAKALEFPDV